MAKRSAALLVYRLSAEDGLEVLVAHMGGPFWARRDAGGWSIPKGECEAGEDPLATARREFTEEMGAPPPDGTPAVPGGVAAAQREDHHRATPSRVISTCPGSAATRSALEWPRGSGVVQEFPEMDRAEWMTVERAATKLVKGQLPILAALQQHLPA